MFVSERIWEIFPQTMTILPTYRCNAACEQCCFESNPKVKGRLDQASILKVISDAREQFPALRMIVFSGGECFLIKDDLYAAIAHASSLGLGTRTVTNGFWGKTKKHAAEVVQRLIEAGLTEANISTGKDHQAWVPFASVVNAAEALIEGGFRTVVTIESDGQGSQCFDEALSNPTFKRLMREHPDLFSIQSNVWMPFHDTFDPTRRRPSNAAIYDGCEQLYRNVVVSPHGQLASCCGLTFEHIPEMKLGSVEERSLRSMATEQVDDLLKMWVALDGPATIMKRLFPDDAEEGLKDVNHICQACAVMYKHPRVRSVLQERIVEFAPEILARFNLRVTLDTAEVDAARAPFESATLTA